jgi:hypothetical protein
MANIDAKTCWAGTFCGKVKQINAPAAGGKRPYMTSYTSTLKIRAHSQAGFYVIESTRQGSTQTEIGIAQIVAGGARVLKTADITGTEVQTYALHRLSSKGRVRSFAKSGFAPGPGGNAQFGKFRAKLVKKKSK